MDKEILSKKCFTVSELESLLQCPVCKRGRLIFDKTKLIREATSGSKKQQRKPEATPMDADCRFNGILRCSNVDCKDITIISGKAGYDIDHFFPNETNNYEETWIDIYCPEYFNPAIELFDISKNCPEKIRNKIIESFNLFWLDYGACANKIRTTVELIMDNQGIKKTTVTKGKRIPIYLHDRIIMFMSKNTEIANHLLAVKWIGNSGSHLDKLNKADLIDAYELLEESINKLYDKKTERLKKISKDISKRKKPRSTKIKKERNN